MRQLLKPFDQLTPEELRDYARIGYALHFRQLQQEAKTTEYVPVSVKSETLPLQDSGGDWEMPAFTGRRP